MAALSAHLPIGAAGLCLAVLALGCDTAKTSSTDSGERIRISEHYGAEFNRGVSFQATLVPGGPGGEIRLKQVEIHTEPPNDAACRKLEAVLGDATFTGGDGDWPVAVVRAGPEAAPFAHRLQIATSLLRGSPRTGSLQLHTTRLFESPPSIALTRIDRDGNQIQLRSLSLVSTNQTSVVSWSEVGGQAGGGEIRLTGQRTSLTGHASENVRMTMSTMALRDHDGPSGEQTP